ncbi:P-loop containing nucleoside triphosphate hydrolase protein [Stipitochalara longipes BDJ]|nr:P-loop containing nucleoside triphosphate hydrolase protein [Stipitochalara longipes BDJ]
MQSIEMLLPQWLVLAKGMSAGQALKLFLTQLEHWRKVKHQASRANPLNSQGIIEFHKVSFAYSSNLQRGVLNDVIFFLPAGDTTFIVGRGGHAMIEDVINVSKAAGFHQTIVALPKGLDTLTGVNEEFLNGSQQQMVIARARLRDVPIVILDEVTSALDHTSRLEVMEEIRKWRENKTTIIITRDISQIHDDEYIYVLDQGSVVQEGYYNDLGKNKDKPFASFLLPKAQADDSTAPGQRRILELAIPPPHYTKKDLEIYHKHDVAQKLLKMTGIQPTICGNLLDQAWRSSLAEEEHIAECAIETSAGQPQPDLLPMNITVLKHQSSSPQNEQRTIWPKLNSTDRAYFLLGFFSAFITAAATPAFAYIFARLLGIYQLQGDRSSHAKRWALALCGIAIIDGVANFCMHYALERSGQAWISPLRVEALKRILAQPRSWLEEENSAARLSECLDRDAEEMRNLVGRIKWEEKCNVMAAQTGDIFTETFTKIRVVRAFTLESYFERKHQLSTNETYKTGISRALYCGAAFGLGDAISYFITAIIFYYGAVIITQGILPVSAVLETVSLLIFGISNSMAILSLVPQLSSSRASATHILKLTNLPLYESLGTHRLATPFPIYFNNLSFTYPSRPHRVLSSVTLTIHPGSCTALVGPSGSGKSTIASLILALNPPDPLPPHCPSPLTFNGIPITQINVSSLRSHIAIVPQQPILFPTSILENIIYGLPEGSPFANLTTATLAARDAGIDEFIISLPNGYQTMVGDGGQGLSGGQTQRIAIARALVRRPKLLILDEATSALDAISAEMIRQTIKTLIERGRQIGEGGIAVLVITHAVEMMRVCEKIVVLDAGTIAESGGFEELKSRGGLFARLIEANSGS